MGEKYNLKQTLEELITKHKFVSVKFLDKKALLDAPGLALDGESFTKKNKKTLVIGSEAVFDYMSISRELRGFHSERYTGNHDELSRVRSELNYNKGFAELSPKKGFFTIPKDYSSNTIKNEADHANYIFNEFRKIHDILVQMNIECEFITTDNHLLAKFKTNQLPADTWKDIGLNSLSQLYYGWSEITLKQPEFKNQYEKDILSNTIKKVKPEDSSLIRDIIKKLEKSKFLEQSDLSDFHPHKFKPNEVVFLTTDKEINIRYDFNQDKLIYFNHAEKFNEIFHQGNKGFNFHGIRPRNRWQEAQAELLMSGADLIVFYGAAGSGKTLLPLAFGAHLLKENIKSDKSSYDAVVRKLFPYYDSITSPKRIDPHKLIDKMTVYRPTETLNQKDVGFLPGEMSNKLAPLVAPIQNNLGLILGAVSPDNSRDEDKVKKLGQKIDISTVLYVRGDTYHNKVIIVDESQNLNDDTLKTIATRTTNSSKIIFTGDPSQDDVSTSKADQAIYYNALTRFIKRNCNDNMPPFMGVLFMPPTANERGVVSRYFLK